MKEKFYKNLSNELKKIKKLILIEFSRIFDLNNQINLHLSHIEFQNILKDILFNGGNKSFEIIQKIGFTVINILYTIFKKLYKEQKRKID